MNVIELLATLFSLLSVVASIKNSVLTWPLGIVGILFYMLHFHNIGLLANTILQLVFLAQCLYGWYNWKSSNDDIIVSSLNKAENTYFGLLFFAINLVIFLLNNSSKCSILDSTTTSLSLVAMILLANKKIQTWYYWIIADIFYILLFLSNKDYLSMITYSVFLFLAITGLKQWNNEKI